jgi:hypothetical protein
MARNKCVMPPRREIEAGLRRVEAHTNGEESCAYRLQVRHYL